MKDRRKLFDTACLEAARVMLGDVKGSTTDDVLNLAEAIQRVCEDACREVEEREGRASQAMAADERALLEKLSDKGGLTFDQCGGPTLDRLLRNGLAEWTGDASRNFLGWRGVAITEAGRALLAREVGHDS
jgi:hypothetical protein